MTQAEAIEAGELAAAARQCDELLESLRTVEANCPYDLHTFDVFDGDEDCVGCRVRVRPWLIVSTVQTLRGVIEQRLAALGVDLTDEERVDA